jgi:hypothetical protein
LRLHFSLRPTSDALVASGAGSASAPAAVDPDQAPSELLPSADTLAAGFLPIGAFHRLCAAVLGSSTVGTAGDFEPRLDRQRAFVAFGKELVTMVYEPDTSSVSVEFGEAVGAEGAATAAAAVDQLHVLVATELGHYGNMHVRLLAPLSSAHGGAWVDIIKLAESPLTAPPVDVGNRQQLTISELRTELAFFLTQACEFYCERTGMKAP